MQICQREGLQVNESTLEALVEGANSDIRLILGQLQMVRLSSRALSYDEVKVCVHSSATHVTCYVLLVDAMRTSCTLPAWVIVRQR